MWLFKVSIIGIAMLLAFDHATQACASEETEQEQILRISRRALADKHSITAAELQKIITAKDASYFIISLQSPHEFARGHIPGANLLKLDYAHPDSALNLLPRDKIIVVTDPNGQQSCQMTIFLRELGYDARTLLLGMAGWNKEFAGTGAFPEGRKLPLANTATPLPLVPPQTSKASRQSDSDSILQKTREYASQRRPVSISHEELAAMKDDALLVSMQSPEDYAYAHIPGAASLPAKIFIDGDQQLLQLPRDKKIVVACYIGHYSNVGAMILNQLGYEAYSLDWGLAGWNISGFKNQSPLLQTDHRFPAEHTAEYSN
ncbi:rhodanese-like domain-containing protein [Desulfovibrio desulfuricans]|uniref:rhodanese-like domain-containing protein n=1 Tax=Desulfovibrio desulfuricans TaxID=876 RepID=UPI0017854CE0|nr:rhodanese-like domain-containing protein [Desulfovibrio desulfuricans]MBD8895093.1 rhodanese-like domain-containing protein [Desulfovibrio desulfuricans]